MNILYKIYFLLPNFARIGIIGKAFNRLLIKPLRIFFDASIPKHLKRTAEKAGSGLNQKKRDETYIVSLTSFPARINEIWIAIETILRQSFKPDKIILWLAESQFPDKKLPESLKKLTQRGLEIKFCKDDLRSHKKYFYVMQQFRKANIITLDDDLYYDKHVLRNLVELHKKFPELIVTNRAHQFVFEKYGQLKKYRKWKHNVTNKKPSHLLLPTGGAGTLYPPNSLPPQAFDIATFKKLCFHADDLWLKAMLLLNNKLVVTNRRYNKDFITIGTTQKQKLVSTNVLNGGNDEQFQNVCEHFEIDLKKLKNETT